MFLNAGARLRPSSARRREQVARKVRRPPAARRPAWRAVAPTARGWNAGRKKTAGRSARPSRRARGGIARGKPCCRRAAAGGSSWTTMQGATVLIRDMDGIQACFDARRYPSSQFGSAYRAGHVGPGRIPSATRGMTATGQPASPGAVGIQADGPAWVAGNGLGRNDPG